MSACERPSDRVARVASPPVIACAPRTGPQRCALCHDDLAAFERVTCARCGSCHHRACTRLPPRCASCSGPLAVRRARPEWSTFSARRALLVLGSGALSMSILLSPALLVEPAAGCDGQDAGALYLRFEEPLPEPLPGPRVVVRDVLRTPIITREEPEPVARWSSASCGGCRVVEEPEDPTFAALARALPELRAPERAASRGEPRGTPTRARE